MRTCTGVSEILCASRLVNSLAYKSISELDSQLRLGSMPCGRCLLPILGDIAQSEPDQCCGRQIAREVALVTYGFADRGVQRFDGVGRVDNLAHLAGEGEERDHRRPVAPPALRDGWIFSTPL